jgi:branched-chain amino acid transport system ATP-binding protein
MEALRIIKDEHRNLWRLAITLDQVIDDMEAEKADGGLHRLGARLLRALHGRLPPPQGRRLPVPPAAPAQRIGRSAPRPPAGRAPQRPHNLAALRQQLADTAAGRSTVGGLAEALRLYLNDQKAHIRTEEQDIYPLAREVLTAADWAEIDAAFLDNDDPVLAAPARAEFRELFHKVASLAPVSVGLGGQQRPASCKRPPARPKCC